VQIARHAIPIVVSAARARPAVLLLLRIHRAADDAEAAAFRPRRQNGSVKIGRKSITDEDDVTSLDYVGDSHEARCLSRSTRPRDAGAADTQLYRTTRSCWFVTKDAKDSKVTGAGRTHRSRSDKSFGAAPYPSSDLSRFVGRQDVVAALRRFIKRMRETLDFLRTLLPLHATLGVRWLPVRSLGPGHARRSRIGLTANFRVATPNP
jgi:hypothetical protein